MADESRATDHEISWGKGGPSIGAPAGVGEHLLATLAGVDGLPDAAPGAPPGDPGTGTTRPAPGHGEPGGVTWEQVLDHLEARLVAWRDALRGAGEFPGSFEWPSGLGECPARLRARARLVLATQRDIEDEMTARRAALGSLLHGIGTTDRRPPVPLFVDQRT